MIHPSTSGQKVEEHTVISSPNLLPPLSKEEAQQVIRAAGHKQSAETLQTLIETKGYTAHQLDGLCEKSKTPLHQACWKGCLECIRYLIEVVGCDVNIFSRQFYSYGKTAIFFALTQSRKDVVQYLLSLDNINVSIVNNKGQSILTLAASHGIPTDTIQQIQSKEEIDLSKWWNFRATHSDHLEYGDLDPRFLERPLRDTDVVTEYAINGTTKQSRKGAFQRRNPEAAKEWQKHRQQSNQSRNNEKNKKKKAMGELSNEQQQAIDNAWQVLSKGCTSNDATSDDLKKLQAIITIIQNSDGLRKPWIPEMATRLLELSYSYSSVSGLVLAVGNGEDDPMKNARTSSLFLKLLAKMNNDNDDNGMDSSKKQKQQLHAKKNPASTATNNVVYSFIHKEQCLKLAMGLQQLSISSLESTSKKELQLDDSTASIVFVDNSESLQKLWDCLQFLATIGDNPFVLAMDSEWATIANHDDGMASTQLSTVQLAFCNPSFSSKDKGKMPPVVVYIVDLLVKETRYQQLAQKLVYWMIYGNDQKDKMWLLGFAMGHDLKIMRKYCKKSGNDVPLHANIPSHSGRNQMLDLQMLLKERTQSQFPTKQPPGLKACAKLFSPFELSKAEQRSDWSRRPLSHSQMQYAALDAAILLFLLVEAYQAELLLEE